MTGRRNAWLGRSDDDGCKVVLLALIWSYLHHFCAGIRFLLLDVHVGVEKEKARASATSVMVVSLILTFVLGLKLFGVF